MSEKLKKTRKYLVHDVVEKETSFLSSRSSLESTWISWKGRILHQHQTDDGYYIYQLTNGQRLDRDPELFNILSSIDVTHRSVRYSTYRCAAKLVDLQEKIKTSTIPYNLALAVLERHGYHQTDITPAIRAKQLVSLIHDILFAADKLNHIDSKDFDIESATSMLSNYMWELYDRRHDTPLSVLQLKCTLAILCDVDSFEERINIIFSLIADHNRCVSRIKFESMLKILSQIFMKMEQNSSMPGQFYSQVSIFDIVIKCFEQCPGVAGLSEHQFNCLWRNKTSPLVNYGNAIGLLHRMKESKLIIHDKTKCSSCEITPVQGLCFRCQVCKKLILCYDCFCRGYFNKKHELSHGMYEVSGPIYKTNRFKNFIRKFLKQLSREKTVSTTINIDNNDSNTVTGYPCKESTRIESRTATLKREKHKEQMDNETYNTVNRRNLSIAPLNGILNMLQQEEENLKLIQTADMESKQLLSEHIVLVKSIISKLMFVTQNRSCGPHSSTPFRQPIKARLSTNSTVNKISDMKGADLNKSYVEANKSNYIDELNNLSWIQSFSENTNNNTMNIPKEIEVNTQLTNFKELLMKVKEIIDDSFSDNIALSEATNNIETYLDDIISQEEQNRQKSVELKGFNESDSIV